MAYLMFLNNASAPDKLLQNEGKIECRKSRGDDKKDGVR
jgi:hypothetical protein